MDIREYFKEAIAEAKKPSKERGAIIYSCSIPAQRWFGKDGIYRFLTDEYIDAMPEDELKLKLATFIANCYRQR